MAALLDSARAQSRASGLSVTWHATPDGFKFEGLPQSKNKNTGEMEDLSSLPRTWLSPATSVDPELRLALGPEPIIAPARSGAEQRGAHVDRVETMVCDPFPLI